MREREAARAAEEGREPAENMGAERMDAPGFEEGERIRVRDRRRVSLDDTQAARGEGAQVEPSLKPTYVEELEARTRAAEQKALDVQSRFEQLRAELRRETDETRQRLSRAADERAQRDKATFLQTLLPVLDNLRRAIEAAEAGGPQDALLGGLRGTLSGFESALQAAGVEAVPSVGARFDPEIHEAVDTAEVEPDRDGEVTAEYERGYKIGNQLLRPARVQVGRARAGVRGAAE